MSNYVCQVMVLLQRTDNQRLSPEESKLAEELQAVAQEAVVKKMAEHDQKKLADLGKTKVDY